MILLLLALLHHRVTSTPCVHLSLYLLLNVYRSFIIFIPSSTPHHSHFHMLLAPRHPTLPLLSPIIFMHEGPPSHLITAYKFHPSHFFLQHCEYQVTPLPQKPFLFWSVLSSPTYLFFMHKTLQPHQYSWQENNKPNVCCKVSSIRKGNIHRNYTSREHVC